MKKILALVLSLLPFTAGADVFSKYAPVAGIQKSTGLDYHNTAAAASDVTPLFGCGGSSTLFLRGDGSCSAPAGTGVTSISVPVPLTASSCSGGACSITWTTGQTANRVLATPDGTTGAVSLRALVAGDVPPINLGSTANGGVSSSTILLGTNGGTSNAFFSVTGPTTALRTFTFPNASATVLTTNAAVTVPQGGTGLATLTSHGVLLGEGTSNLGSVAAMAADTLLQGQGATSDPAAVAINNCGSSTTALSYSTSTHTFGCQTISVGGTGTVTSITGGTGITASPNPIVSTGTLTVNQAFSPTWTGLHTWTVGGIFNGVIGGSSPDRSDAQLILTNITAGTGHALLDLYNVDKTDEAAITFDSKDSLSAPVQLVGQYARFVNSINTSTSWQGVWGIHLQDPVNGDCNLINAWSGGALQLLAPCATISPWNSPPPSGWVNIHGSTNSNTSLVVGTHAYSTTAGYVLEANGFAQFGNVNGSNTTNDAIQVGWSAGSSKGFIQSYSNDSAVFEPLVIGGSTIELSNTSGLTVDAPTGAGATALLVLGHANNATIRATGSSTTGQSYGLQILAGTNSTDNALQVLNQAAGTTFLTVAGDGGTTFGTPTGGDKGLGTVNMTGCFVNNVPCLTGASGGFTKFAAGLMTTSAGNTCVINTNGGGISSCSEAAAGRPVVTFVTSYFPTSVFCVGTGLSANTSLLVNTNGISLNQIQVYITQTGSNVDGSFTLTCFGN